VSRCAIAAGCCSLALAGCAAEAAAPPDPPPDPASAKAPRGCIEPALCVYMAPKFDRSKTRVLYTYWGRGWRPRKPVEAEYGSFCTPDVACAGVGRSTQVRANRNGRFAFRFWAGPRRPKGVRKPVGYGSGPVQFRQWRGRPYRSGERTRDAIPLPVGGSAQDVADARSFAEASFRVLREIRRHARSTGDAAIGYNNELGRCRDIVNKEDPPAVEAVVRKVTAFHLDDVLYGPIQPALARFAAEVEAAQAADPVLRAGADAWAAHIREPRYHPAPSLCAVLRRWRDTGYAPAAAPVDPEAPTLGDDVFEDRRLEAAGTRMRRLGSGRVAAEMFGGGLLDIALVIGER
jgi:hypothetical protein